ncbi:uncharacterized protein MONOS_880 [Monocercomonoides exilis]|uniref:uncharacterized protein n=1 Tax=Monocercomonoides exilis TaxID=2049356 RepID=UPI00355956E0|nr:hypothetical protein MONOS_880 [Monocercomonoides exilis]|eukprot:MONOS_880.1-p1 / transcript=MONOS_880.1 / gene=MONOS_880 / organism=Monocercomonoides_exilis_PA203 / gene_product=unspecified product / transcript_product=unspecified product / location=Mono_scaffold00014:203957-205009(-) / protein_length=351 / sequence_SO=supercontig / SO=protein_coding / is_pseudo=false
MSSSSSLNEFPPEEQIAVSEFLRRYEAAFGASRSKMNVPLKDRIFVLHDLYRSSEKVTALLNVNHLGVLFNLDEEKKGFVTVKNYVALYQKAVSLQTEIHSGTEEFKYQFECFCVWTMFTKLKDSTFGVSGFINWIQELTKLDKDVSRLPKVGDEIYLHLSTIKYIFLLFDIQRTIGYDLQQFLEVLHSVGSEQGLSTDAPGKYDRFVPMRVLVLFLSNYIKGFVDSMTAYGVPLAAPSLCPSSTSVPLATSPQASSQLSTPSPPTTFYPSFRITSYQQSQSPSLSHSPLSSSTSSATSLQSLPLVSSQSSSHSSSSARQHSSSSMSQAQHHALSFSQSGLPHPLPPSHS